MKQLGPRIKVQSVIPLGNTAVRVTFENGVTREIDLRKYMQGPIFAEIRSNPDAFRAVKIEGGTIAWENGADIDPDVLYYDLTPAALDEDVIRHA